MNRVKRFIILLIGVAGFSSCGAVTTGFLYPDEPGFLKAEPSRVIYSIQSSFIKERDLTVFLYKVDGGLSKLPIEDVTTMIRGEAVDFYRFGEEDPGTWNIGVSYADMEPTEYTITVLNAREEAYYDNGGPGHGVGIIITGP
ncbi:putative lipoprotein [Treponema primitia ZAS-2]|uniref:Putative lipoprotein n=1 Tax=Treponema primitia (strain ATCC BAA-887 / DSM 12427 / ZAS-2) TaxID=545694 RepID=F5YJM0_TREPZ|nr:hypothetical protein [Treponema primitia]AEF84903.1 putative lipoprotein [Treponema primitia ZAS-2]